MVGSQSMLVSGTNAVLSHRVQTPCEVFISKPCTCQRKVWRSLAWRVWKIFGYLTCRFCSGYHLANVQNMLASARELIDTAITCYHLKAGCWQFNQQAFFQTYPTSIVPIHKKRSGRSIHPSRRCGWSVVRFTWRSGWPQCLVGLAICRMSSDQNLSGLLM